METTLKLFAAFAMLFPFVVLLGLIIGRRLKQWKGNYAITLYALCLAFFRYVGSWFTRRTDSQAGAKHTPIL